ncbi:hypothetical protein [Pseudarthrobacter sp. Y6]|uniref:hypothetical protein n=1 Tax=Pseudarthrobacter sp. Y6 TaxID=3418422 RepID=UPI003CECC32F
MGKVAEEAMWAQLVRWEADLSISSLRFTNVVAPGDYGTFARASDPAYRLDLTFSYIDSRDGATAVALALEQSVPGFEVYDVAASDTGSAIPAAELAALHFPGVSVCVQGLANLKRSSLSTRPGAVPGSNRPICGATNMPQTKLKPVGAVFADV